MSEPSPEQSFTIHLKSLTDFADEFTTQIQSLQAPMDHLATMSGTPPQYGAFHEAWSLGAGEQAAVEEMYSLLDQVKQAIAFAGDVTGTVADGYRRADDDVAWGLGGAPAPDNNGGAVASPWAWAGQGDGQGQDQGQNQPYQYSDPTQNNQNDQNQVIATPVGNPDANPWTPNQNNSGPYPSGGGMSPLGSVVGAVLGGTLLAGAARNQAHRKAGGGSTSGQNSGSGNGSGNGNAYGNGNGSAPSGGALPLWNPPQDAGGGAFPQAPASDPLFPGQDSTWTASYPDSPQGGTRP